MKMWYSREVKNLQILLPVNTSPQDALSLHYGPVIARCWCFRAHSTREGTQASTSHRHWVEDTPHGHTHWVQSWSYKSQREQVAISTVSSASKNPRNHRKSFVKLCSIIAVGFWRWCGKRANSLLFEAAVEEERAGTKGEVPAVALLWAEGDRFLLGKQLCPTLPGFPSFPVVWTGDRTHLKDPVGWKQRMGQHGWLVWWFCNYEADFSDRMVTPTV